MDWTFRLNAIPGSARAGRPRRRAARPRERAHALLAIALVAGSPIAYLALDAGHPEDVLAAAAATAGVLAAVRSRATLSAVLLTVAVLAKQTAVLALLPAALALPEAEAARAAAPVARRAARLRRPAARCAPAGRPRHAGVAAGSFFHPVAGLVAASASRPTPAWAAAGHGDDHLAGLARPDPAPADRRARAAAQPALVVARAAATARARTRWRCSRCWRSSAACSTRGTSATTTCRSCSRSPRGRPRSAARR